MSIKKQYLKSKPECKVTLSLPKAAAATASTVSLVGEFNGWDPESTPMKKLKSGDFKTTVNLKVGSEYEFRYLIDGERWENDWAADKYVANVFSEENSVVVV